jgi:hypothetical protein
MRRQAASMIAAVAILSCAPAFAASPGIPPVTVHIDAVGDQCIFTADGQPFDPAKPLPLPLRQQMLGRGVRLTYADPKPDFHCISGAVFPLQAEGVDIRN